MPEVPKIVYDRLRAAAAGGHPDANLLGAFAEQALAAAEREAVLQHLAQCGECRETLALTVLALETVKEVVPERPASADSAARVSAGRRQTWFTWNRLGWVGLAAGIAIAAVFVMQPGRQKSVNEAQQKPAVTAAAPDGKAEMAKTAPLPSPPPEVATSAQSRPAAVAPPVAARRDEFRKLGKSVAVPGGSAGQVSAPRQGSAPSAAAPGTPTAGANRGQISGMERLKESVGSKDVQGGQAYDVAASRPQATTESVEVTAGAPVTESEQVADTLAEKKAAPVIRAKAARALDAPTAPPKIAMADAKQGTVTVSNEQDLAVSNRNAVVFGQAASKAVGPRVLPQWAIRGDALERSFDSGAHWTTVFQAHRALLCVGAANTEVWAGGKSGDLFHSADSGATWTQVHPAAAGQALTDDVIHIDVQTPTQVVLSTNKNELWSTTDNGTTWAKK